MRIRMRDEASITRQLHRDRSFVPPYCPNAVCKNHHPSRARKDFYSYHSKKPLVRFPYLSHRFQCKDCDATFVSSAFQLHYRQKVWGHNEFIFSMHGLGVSKRAIARLIGHDEGMVRLRLTRMSQWAQLKDAELTKNLEIKEPIVYDGLENFSFSQYEPNNINHAVGKDSLFTYDMNFAPMNRKGKMNPAQKRKKTLLEDQFGEFPKNILRTTTKRIFERLLARTKKPLRLFTDRHFQYRNVVHELNATKTEKERRIQHWQTSSKAYRNYRNPLFAVNNIDMQARHNLAAFKRETIAFAKHSIAMQESFNLYVIHRNYMRPKFWGTHRSDPESSKKSPAMEVGIAKSILTFKEFFGQRVMLDHVRLNEDALNLYRRIDPLSRHTIAN